MSHRLAGLEPERHAELALIPALATAGYYLLPSSLQGSLTIQFLPQALAYLLMAVWASRNSGIVERLGLSRHLFHEGARWGVVTGTVLGGLNLSVLLWAVPALGEDIGFLRETPHAKVPIAVMLPWGICLIAILVELNFRGFLLGRLLALCQRARLSRTGQLLAVPLSALVFSFDPFMVSTFRHLHWIAIWDGLVWGIIWLRLRNLYAPMVAHAVEVIILYAILRHVLT